MEEEWDFSLDFQRNIDNILSIIIGQMIIFGSDDSKRFSPESEPRIEILLEFSGGRNSLG